MYGDVLIIGVPQPVAHLENMGLLAGERGMAPVAADELRVEQIEMADCLIGPGRCQLAAQGDGLEDRLDLCHLLPVKDGRGERHPPRLDEVRQIGTVKSDPVVDPGIANVGLIENRRVRRDQEAVTAFQRIGAAVNLVFALAGDDAVQNVMVNDLLTGIMAVLGFVVAAVRDAQRLLHIDRTVKITDHLFSVHAPLLSCGINGPYPFIGGLVPRQPDSSVSMSISIEQPGMKSNKI